MMKKGRIQLMLLCAIAALASSCSTVKVLQDDQRRLISSKITVTNDKKFNTYNLTPYLKQKADGWSPFLYVYNWENGEGKGWDKFVHKLGKAPVIYDSTLVESSKSNIYEHLRYIGYYDSKVEATVDSSKVKKAKVAYSVTLGKRYRINSIKYELPKNSEQFTKEFYSDTTNCSIAKGDYLSEQNLEKESVRGAASMHEAGFYDFSKNYYFFEADTVSKNGYADLNIIVKNHTRNENSDVQRVLGKYRFGRISVSYPEDIKFRTKALKNLNMLQSGELYSDSKINTQYSRFSSVNYFNAVGIQLNPREGENIVDCDIQLKKSKTQGFKVGLEASISTTGLWGVSPEVSYYHKNIFHGGEFLNLSVNTNHQFMHRDNKVQSHEVTAAASLVFPKFFPFPTRWFRGPDIPKTEIKLSYNYHNRPEYIRHISSASFGYVGKYKDHLFYQAYPVSFNYIHLPYIDKDFLQSLQQTNMALLNSFKNHLDLGISATLYYNTSSNIANPQDDHWFTRFKFDLSGNMLSMFNSMMEIRDGMYCIKDLPYSQYVRAEWEIGKTFVFGKKENHSLAGRILVGYGKGYGNSKALPFEKRFYSGGANSLRGWVARTLGPGCSKMNTQWKIPNQTGDMKLEANLEYRFNIFWKISGALFVEAGNTWEVPPVLEESDPSAYFSFKNLGESLAADWGVGLRVNLNFILLRLDYGMRIHDPACEQGERWKGPKDWFKRNNHAIHFGVGLPF